MSDSELTHVTLVLDRSGSMHSVRDDAIGGFNAFVEKQRKLPGRATLTLVQFDDAFEEIYRGMPIGQVPLLDPDTYVPRGSTALYDALGRSLAETFEYVRSLEESSRPSRVMVVVLTDGEENSSKEYGHTRVQAVVEEANAKPNWEVLFLAASLKVVAEAERTGVPSKGTMVFHPSGKGTRSAFDKISSRVTSVRSEGTSDTPDDDDSGPILH